MQIIHLKFYNNFMEIKTYKKDSFYTYILGAFPTIELLKNHPEEILKIVVSSSFKNQEVINLINSLRGNKEMAINDKLLDKLSNKENCYVAGILKKYYMEIEPNQNHLVLVNPMNMGNFGTIVRSSLGFGIKNIVIIKPAIDIFDPKVLRATMGSFFSCNIVYFNSIEEYKNRFSTHKLVSFMLQAKKSLQKVKFSSNELVSLVFGNESSGLPIEYLNDDSLIINHSHDIDSLNLPTAVGIALYEFAKQTKKS